MPYRDAQSTLRAIYAIAVDQGGYFTAKQAAAAGYEYPHLVYHARVGNFERVGHGLYRLPTIPLAEHDDLIRLALWSRGRNDVPQAVVSHASAMFLHDLSDVLPTKIHLSVPPSFRKAAPTGCVLHKVCLYPADIESREGFSLTTPLRTLCDLAASPRSDVTDEHLRGAIRDAIGRGMVRESVIKQALKTALPPDRRTHFRSLIA